MKHRNIHVDVFTLITGASDGIGFALAQECAADKKNLILVARNKKKLLKAAKSLKDKYGIKTVTIAKDLSKPVAAKQLFAELKKKKLKVDILVNNAGFGLHGNFADTDLKTEIEMIQLNVTTVVELCKRFISQLENHGAILNVASTGAFQPGPYMNIYYASKAFLLSFSESLRVELAERGISVSILCPGPVQTPFHERAGTTNTNLTKGNLLPVLSASDVAKQGYQGLKENKAIIIPGIVNKIQVQSVRFSPRAVVRNIAKKILQ